MSHAPTAAPRDETRPAADPTGPGPGWILLVAAWSGLLGGLVELGLLLATKPIRDPSPGLFRMNRHVVWMIPTVHLGLFAGVGVAMAVVALRWRRAGWRGIVFASMFAIAVTAALTFRGLSPWACVLLALGLGWRLARHVGRREASFRRLVRWTTPILAAVAAIVAGGSFSHEVVAGRWSGSVPSGLPEPTPGASNVLLIVLDTVRADRLSCQGYGRGTTPNLDRIAARGIRFERARSAAPWTLPSHASLFTGRWPHELSAGMEGPLDGAAPTLAEYLASRGYATAGFAGNLNYATAETGLARGFARFEDHEIHPGAVLHASALVDRFRPTTDRKTAVEVDDGLLAWLDGVPADRPFFAFANYFDVHNPYVPPAWHAGRFGLRPESADDDRVIDRWLEIDRRALPPRQLTLASAAYDACLAGLDAELGRLFDALERRGRLDDTLIVVTSDHGEHFGEHGLHGHASSLYGPEIHVPLIVVPPSGRGRSRAAAVGVVPRWVSLRDLAATVVDAAGVGQGSPFPGRSLAADWSGEPGRTPTLDDRPLLSEVEGPVKSAPNHGRSPAFRGAMRNIVVCNSSFVRNGDGVEELYDLGADPGEVRDLARHPESAVALNRLRVVLDDLLRTTPATPRSLR